MKLNVNLGISHISYLISRCKTKRKNLLRFLFQRKTLLINEWYIE